MAVLVVSGTGTEIGKTVLTAAVAVLSGRSVAVLKPAQTGDASDVDAVRRLAGPGVTGRVLGAYPEPLAPETAARRAGLPPVTPGAVAAAARELAAGHELVLVEGAGGLLVRYDPGGGTIADAAALLGAPVLVVTTPGLGTLNTTALTTEALRHRGIGCAGLVIGAWPADPDLAMRCNLADLPVAAGTPLIGALPAGCGALPPAAFAEVARASLAPALGGTWDAAAFTRRYAPATPAAR